MNIIARLEYELAYYDSAVHRFNHYTTRTPPYSWCDKLARSDEKKDKYFDLARELKKLLNMKVTIIRIVIGAFGTITKGLLKGLDDLEVGGLVESIQMTALLRTVRILRKVQEI